MSYEEDKREFIESEQRYNKIMAPFVRSLMSAIECEMLGISTLPSKQAEKKSNKGTGY